MVDSGMRWRLGCRPARSYVAWPRGGSTTCPHSHRGGHHVDTTAEKRKAALRRPSHNALISLGKFGAGEGIRTLDPNLGKVPERSTPWYPAVRYDTKLYDESLSWLTSNPPPVSRTYPTTCFQVLGIRVDEGYDSLILSKLPVGG
jgi:hypothetical protein